MDGQEDYVPPEAHQVAAHHPGRGILSRALLYRQLSLRRFGSLMLVTLAVTL
jgi:hypothetical protein